ncbi:amino acid adenylation domain-containing protein [Streptomyces sp. M2CJ-2]|uniref:non-ribosomal peptide synthetase/type I polyketide synthase n=1 Tax=Streptomyces sp. M2CJ-2 TaxID=2803948 RepID=UPI0019292A6A|nr:non-ribosomal peptide synthetase/type I polyketide synthase [Streptomyces sp. M2CJ-2]MBL3668245.1 amino acid adenylation domain-containing protein [Streptomyces sp. M2CJ-2]
MNAATLLDVLLDAAHRSPGQVIVHVRGDGGEVAVTFRELVEQALRVAGGLRAAGVAPGTCLPVLAEDSADFQPLFWGVLAAGAVPVPLAPDVRRVRPVWEHLGRPPVVVDAACAPMAAELPDGAEVLRLDALRACPPLAAPAEVAPDELAFLQFSSGSTGTPKGVELTHTAVLANLRQLTEASALTEHDVVVSWMPYFHDMGLIGTHLAPLAARAKQVKIGPLSFAKNPRLWFDVAAAHRATVLSAANFALALTLRRVPAEVFAGLDLSAVRLVLVGAEPISATVWRDFTARTRASGLDPRAATPVYGLAEATLAVAFPPLGEVAVPVAVERAALSRGRVVEREPGGDAVELMDVGVPVPGCSVRITDGGGRVLGDRRVGHIEVSGPQIARGYHGLPDATERAFADSWLRTGDLGFLRDGRLCVSGRHKDVLFVNGRTFHAPDLEEVAAGTAGVPAGTTVVVGSTDPVSGGERVVVFVAWARPPRTASEVLDRVARRVRAALGHDDVRVLALPPSAFPRTTSGKVRRQLMRSRFEAGTYRPSARSAAVPGDPVERPRPSSAGPGSAPRSRGEVRRAVREAWAGVLGLPQASFGDRERFAELGGTSIRAMEALAGLERSLGVALGPAVMRNDTVATLTDHLMGVVGTDAAEGTATQEEEAASAAYGQEGASAAGRADGASATAVVGLACRFPGADTPEEFWDLLIDGRDAVSAVPLGRWRADGRTGPGQPARWGAFLDDPAAFDAGHFGIGDEEARTLDPQARVFLELAHEALERAGYAGSRRRGLRTGVFAAVGDSGYRQLLAEAGPAGASADATALTGNLPNLVAARVAHCLDLDGPALAVDTACSSGLVALHLARRSLADGECDVAVVGGVNLHLTPSAHQALEAARALSPTGRSRAFSTAADGFVPGEGGAVLVLRRLEEARRDDDVVLAVVRGTAVNNDGTSLSLLAPNPLRQREVIGRAYAYCGVDPASVTYVEAHGTGTAVGDPIELRSLAHAFPARPDGRPRLLGSVKTNVGHLLNAAALPSLVKVVLALGHGRLPASLHHAPVSPAVERSGFALVTEVTAWESSGPRRAGINAFGFGGTNAHAVLEQAPPSRALPPAGDARGPNLLTLSAGSAAGLDAWTARVSEQLRDHPEFTEGDVCLTAGAARDERPHRLAVVADGELRERLASVRAADGAPVPGAVAGTVTHRPRTVFVLPGQGGLRPGQGRELYDTAPVYRTTLDEASALVGAVHGRELTAWCVDGGVDASSPAATEVAQPLLVAHGVALARQLTAWGVRPDAVVGHSVGELAAACVGGMLSLSEAVLFAAERGRLMGGSTAPGAMAAVRGADERAVEDLVAASPGDLAVAAYNGPGRLVISGTPGAVRQASELLTAQGATVRALRVSRAFHSPLMAPVAPGVSDAARRLLNPSVPALAVMSTLTAEWQPRLDPDHLREHALRPVLFGRAVDRLLDEGYDTFVELGPGENLAGPIRAAAARRRHLDGARDGTHDGALVVSAPVRPSGTGAAPGGARELMETVARLWVRGVPLDRRALDAGHRRVQLPPYPYRRRRYWPEPDARGLLHRVGWRPAPLPGDGLPGPVLVTGADPVAVRRLTDGFAAVGVRAVTADDGEVRPQTVVLLGGPDRPDPAEDLEGDLRQAVAAFQDALTLLDRSGARRLLVVTEDAHVTGHGVERAVPGRAVPGGLALAVPEESAGVVANWVDLSSHDAPGLPGSPDSPAGERWLRALASELTAPQAAGAVAWRGGRRLVRTVAPGTAGATGTAGAAGAAGKPVCEDRLPVDGAYLVTGGAGGIGSALARDLAGRGRPVLVLAGRSPNPPSGLLKELTDLGADARYVMADLTAPDDVERLVRGLPPLDAVFHAAGVVRPGSLRGTDVRETVDALGAKTLGTVLLAGALQRHGQLPGVCVAFSSVSSVLPGLAGALGGYAAANAFLDSFAGAERLAGRPWLSVNLGPFAETGLAVAAGLGALDGVGSRAVGGGRPLATAPALTALRTACGTDAAQLVLADLAPAPRPAAVPPRPARPTAVERSGDTDDAGGRRPAVPADTAVVLRELLAQSLGVPASAVDDDTPFLRLGLDSLGAVDLVKRLERRLGRQLPTTLFFEHRTVRELAAHLKDHIGEPSVPTTNEPGPGDRTGAGNKPSFALTPVQLALHTSSRLHPDVPARGHLRLTVRGPLDTGLLGRALAALAERHGMLRLRVDDVREPGGLPTQRTAPPVPLSDWYEVRDCAADEVDAAETAVCNQPFDLAALPPVRAVLLRREPALAHLLLVVHHVAADGYSLNLLAEELWNTYTALCHEDRPQQTLTAPDFARYASSLPPSDSAERRADRRYWSERLAARGEPLRLPYDSDPDASVSGPSGPIVQHYGELDAELTAGLEKLAAAQDISLFHLLLATYVRCLARWSKGRDVAVNVARARREDRFEGVDRLVGPLADTLPLLCRTVGDEGVLPLAERLRRIWLQSERHAGLGSLDLAALLPGAAPGAGAGPRTVSPAGFSFARFPVNAAADCPVEVRATAAGTGSAATRLSLLCWADGPLLRWSWNFPEPLFRRATVARLDREFRAELTAVLGTPPSPGSPAPPPDADAVRSVPSPVPSPLVARLLDRFRDRPDADAVDATGGTADAVDAAGASLSYGALDRASALLAARLRALGVRPGDLVGLLTEPGADTVVGVVGILRAGAGWVPLDPEHPVARLTDQLVRTGATTVVCHAATRQTADALTAVRAVPVLGDAPVDGGVPVTAPEAPAAPAAPPGAEAIAYVIFTSGSTGRPKAVPITHRAMENYLDWAVAAFGYGADDRLAQTASPCFDASVRQLLAPLLVGGTVVTVPRALLRDPELLLTHVERARVTVWSSVPTLWEQLLSAAEARARSGAGLPDLTALRWVHVGGEALPVDHVRRWFDLFGNGARIANLYGPTESTINATCHVIDSRPGDEVRQLPIGRPVAGTDLEVVRADGTPCEPGEPGELLIAGTGLTPGYLGEPELTGRAFALRAGRRWYRSGDRVRRSADGTVEFLGRIDDQVKIRGNRVEPGEVEAALQGCPGVARAAVIAHEGRLLAFVTPRSAADRPDTREVRRCLAGLLPSYMLPTRVTCLDELPLTGTGKVDRLALVGPAPGSGATAVQDAVPAGSALPDGDGTSPATVTERRMAEIWSDVLQVASVRREDDFFDLGGDSLLVLRVFSRLAELEAPLPRPTVIYRHRTLAALSAAVDAVDADAVKPRSASPSPSPAPAPDDRTAPFPVTPGQRGFLLAEALSPGGGTWLARLRLSGPLDPDVFQAAVDLLVERHGMLRTVFPAGARPPVQQELPPSLRLPVAFATVATPAEVDERAAAEAARRLEPWAWPLVRLQVLSLAPQEHVLLVHAHHVIGDGYSAALLMQELTEVYDRLAGGGSTPHLPALRGDFRGHVRSLTQAGHQAGVAGRARERRRARVCAPYRPPVLRTTVSGNGEEERTGDRGDVVFRSAEFALGASPTAALRALAARARTTLYAPLLTAYYQELAALTGRPDLIVGLAVSGRDGTLPDAHRVFGPFATAVPVRPASDGPLCEGGFGGALRRIAAEAEEARTHEDVVPRSTDGFPLTSQFFFTFLDFSALAPAAGGTLRLSWESGDSTFLPPAATTDVFMAVRPDADGVRVTVRGSAAVFAPGTLDRFADSVRRRLIRAASGGGGVPDQPGTHRPAPRPSGSGGHHGPGTRDTMDAALVGYLPAPGHLARLAGLPGSALPRAELRDLLFPDGAPRLLETVRTPLGRSGFVCVPLFADELAAGSGLVGHTARAVSLAAARGARCVSLAGMIPSLTGYGFDVLRSGSHPAAVTTGHAATVVAVVRTVHAALEATGRDLSDLDVAFAGLGSIGASSLELLLSLAARPPRRLLLCDVRGSGPRLAALGRRLRERGLVGAGGVEVAESERVLPDAVHGADLLVTAVSGATAVLDVDRLRPGAVVVDDSFPHCFDTERALVRMREHDDVLVLGGGLLHVGRTDREVAEDLPAVAAAGYLAQPWIEGTLASCRAESLLHAAGHELPLVHGLVDAEVSLAYWEAVERAGVSAAPLHLLGHTVGGAPAV